MIDKLAWIHIEDRKILGTRSKGKNVFYIPGGKREPGEGDEQALTREVKEELSVDLIAHSIKPYGIFEAQAHGKAEGTIVRMTCFTADYSGKIDPDNEIEELKWLTHKDRDISPPVDILILDDLKEKDLID